MKYTAITTVLFVLSIGTVNAENYLHGQPGTTGALEFAGENYQVGGGGQGQSRAILNHIGAIRIGAELRKAHADRDRLMASYNNAKKTNSHAVALEYSAKIRAHDIYMGKLYGEQALYDLRLGNTARATALWRHYSGANITVIPYTNGQFGLSVEGSAPVTVDYNYVVRELRGLFDREPRR